MNFIMFLAKINLNYSICLTLLYYNKLLLRSSLELLPVYFQIGDKQRAAMAGVHSYVWFDLLMRWLTIKDRIRTRKTQIQTHELDNSTNSH